MSRATYPLKLPISIKKEAQRLAQEDGVSLNQWISVAVAQKVGSVMTAAEFFAQRGKHAKPGGMLEVLAKVPRKPPKPGDELE